MPQNNDIYPEPSELKPWQTKLANFFGRLIGRAILTFVDLLDLALKPFLAPWVKGLRDDPDIPPDLKPALARYLKDGTPAMAMFGLGMAGGAAGGVASAAMSPWLELIKRSKATHFPFMNFDYMLALAGWLRGVMDDDFVKSELKHLGWSEEKIEMFKKLVWMRLDPIFVQQIWLRDKGKYEHLWKDLHDIGWDDERIDVYKELAHIVPPVADMVRFADFGSFDPHIIELWRKFYDAPEWIKAPMAKAGITGEWADKYWFSHWTQPGRYELGLMRRRDYIDDETVKNAYLTQGYSSFWQELLLKLVWEPYTRVDVRRMYKVGVLDEAGVKRAYMDLGYDDEKAAKLTEFTLKYYGRDEDDVEDEQEKIRELTRADICDGYRRGVFTAAEAGELLAKLAYTPESIQFYIDRENLKKDQALKDAYATNYRQLFVIGLKDADSVKSELVELGLLPGEVDEYLKVWYVEKLRRQAKPSRTDLARFLKKEIITEATWRQSMADLGYGDKYIEWYLADMKE